MRREWTGEAIGLRGGKLLVCAPRRHGKINTPEEFQTKSGTEREKTRKNKRRAEERRGTIHSFDVWSEDGDQMLRNER